MRSFSDLLAWAHCRISMQNCDRVDRMNHLLAEIMWFKIRKQFPEKLR